MSKIQYSVFFVLLSLSALSFFQNCSATKFKQLGSTSSSTVTGLNSAPEPLPTTEPIKEIPRLPVDLKMTLIHVSGHRDFTVSVLNLAESQSNCQFQYEKNGSIWTNLGDELRCNSDVKEIKLFLPSSDLWTNNFIKVRGGVRIRLIKTTDQSVIGVFPKTLVCDTKTPSMNATPDIDENCNGKWDDVELGENKKHMVNSNAITFGSTYSCDATSNYENKKSAFVNHVWSYRTSFYKSSDCNINSLSSEGSGAYAEANSSELSGITPIHDYSGGCQDWDSPVFINNKIEYIPGYTTHYASWSISSCVYTYPSFKNFN